MAGSTQLCPIASARHLLLFPVASASDIGDTFAGNTLTYFIAGGGLLSSILGSS